MDLDFSHGVYLQEMPNQSDFPSYDIQGTDKTLWFDNNGVFDYYFSPDFNLDGDINGQDKSLWFENNGISSRVPKERGTNNFTFLGRLFCA